ncbi:alpha-ketoglutarate-dependent dioxygenase AlkB family protein [Christiangramia sediminis]|uniref:Alpha-ketoglutarate-dependent dioxygenase AlkB n=1 Tax=Christiangramia sediminis TaxID=2881336 RepID=A0A9X1LIG0_9FLAO|nr:alpha-ketoglutarate-dependent dioxygenase AlkB [Christiangramia sediminis]MCB7480912.1 alpha-ketoglutarate-dependent dioxygenase AlkB [Christiangramia sediminis]
MREIINLQDAELEYFPNFLNEQEADATYEFLMEWSTWKQDKIKLFGKDILQPRLTTLFGEKGKTYKYSGLEMSPISFPDELNELKIKVEKKISGIKFNVCLANLYRDGNDSMGWHADDEKELGVKPVIASVSLGAERIFHLKHKKDPTVRHKIRLQHGSLLIMKGKTQEFWKHQLPKTKKIVSPRINLTFRKIY